MSGKVQGDNPNYRPNRPEWRKDPQKFNPMSAEPVSEEASGGEGMSSSAKTMKATSADIIINLTHCYRIIEFISVFAAISDISVCKTCKRKQTFGETGSNGLGFKIAVTCACGTVLINSGPVIKNNFEINRRIVFVMRLLGVARKGINMFCGLMDLGCELSARAYDGIIQHIHTSLQKMYNDACHKAVEEESQYYEKEEQPLSDLKVLECGSWKKRGFSSLYGVTTLIGYNTGKVIDLLVKSSYCQICTNYKNDKDNSEYLEHNEDEHCAVNRNFSAGPMESDAIEEMFLRSEQLHGVRYSLCRHTLITNESFKEVVWGLAPKHLNCGSKIIEIAAFLAAGIFNEGFSFVLQTMQDLNILIGQHSKGFADNEDKRRIEQQERRSLDATKEAFRQQWKTPQLEQFEEEEGLLYGPEYSQVIKKQMCFR